GSRPRGAGARVMPRRASASRSAARCTCLFNPSARREIYPLSLHDALPICHGDGMQLLKNGRYIYLAHLGTSPMALTILDAADPRDRKSTRLNSSHLVTSYAVFCLKKKRGGRPHRLRKIDAAGAQPAATSVA